MSMLLNCNDGRWRHKHFKTFQASIWNKSWNSSNTVALLQLQNVLHGGCNCKGFAIHQQQNKMCFVQFLWNCSQLSQKCALKMCWGAPKPNPNPLLMYNTSVWHSWVSAKPFSATLIFFICSLVKVKKEKGDKRLHILTQPWQILCLSTCCVLLLRQNPHEGLEENCDVLWI